MVLVTGGTGMLGASLIEILHKQGETIRAIYRNQIPVLLAAKAEWVMADILDVISLEQAMVGITAVYHCAGFVSFSPSQKWLLNKINVEGTANIVNACLAEGVSKLVHVSSVAALGRIRPGAIITEEMEWTEETSNSEYGKSKWLAETEVWRGMAEGLNAVVVNPTIIFGQHGDWAKGSMAIFKNVYEGFPWYATGSTGFVDANDVCRAMILLMKSEVSAQRFIISAENKTYQEVFFMIADAFGKKRPSKKVTPMLAAIVWRVEQLKKLFTKKEPLVTKETAATALTKVSFNNNKFLKTFPAFAYSPINQSVNSICAALKKGK